MNELKQHKEISGILQFPIAVGIPAYIAETDGVIRTSTVVKVYSRTPEKVVFETRNTIYTLNLSNAAVRTLQREAVAVDA